MGKTWALQEFGRTCFSNCLYINFEKQPEYRQFFQTTKDVRRILPNLAMSNGERITPETLIVFDEIQECGEALNTLRKR